MNKISLSFVALAIALASSYAYANGDNSFGEWQNLSGDNDLSNWLKTGGDATYEARDNMIVGTTGPGPNTFLYTNRIFSDFELEYEFNVDPTLNSGVQIRSHIKPLDNGSTAVWGYQIEIDPSERAWTAGIYEEKGRKWLNDLTENPAAQQAFRQNEWNHVRILAVGDHLQTWLNGVPAADLADGRLQAGFIALQVHSIKDDVTRHISWRNIRIRELVK